MPKPDHLRGNGYRDRLNGTLNTEKSKHSLRNPSLFGNGRKWNRDLLDIATRDPSLASGSTCSIVNKIPATTSVGRQFDVLEIEAGIESGFDQFVGMNHWLVSNSNKC